MNLITIFCKSLRRCVGVIRGIASGKKPSVIFLAYLKSHSNE